jgi:2,5-dioxopentanoate dehydrogenase
MKNNIDQTVRKADQAFGIYRQTPIGTRAEFLNRVAMAIEDLGDALIRLVGEETHLPAVRLEGERTRTCNQLRMFASLLQEGSWVEAVIDTAMPDRSPVPRPDLRRMLFPLGPVVVFGAGNFPLAFSTAGGDTASALAAGCPVILKGHPAHPGTSRMVAEAIEEVIRNMELPEGLFQHVEGGSEEGQELVKHPLVKAVAFTGSFEGGMALFRTAVNRTEPIPVYLEMGSVNPIFVLPEKMMQDAAGTGKIIAQSVLLGTGQFCTNPGIIFVPAGSEQFIETIKQIFINTPAEPMLHGRIAVNFYIALESALRVRGVETITRQSVSHTHGAPSLALTSLENWLKNPDLQNEVFGPFTLLVEYKDTSDLQKAAKALNGQLTCTLLGTETELEKNADLIDLLREKCGRLLFAGVPTGLEVSHAMTHGGPFPATSDSRSTSVGTYSIKRFVRPVTWQNSPRSILPDALKDQNPLGIYRIVNGNYTNLAI